MRIENCPKCHSPKIIKSGIVNQRQRYTCKACNYNFTVDKIGKKIDDYYITKALQLYLEGLSYREIERILGVSHVTVSNWVRHHKVKRLNDNYHHPTYRIITHNELIEFLKDKDRLAGAGMIITELGDKFMLIKWECFKD